MAADYYYYFLGVEVLCRMRKEITTDYNFWKGSITNKGYKHRNSDQVYF